MLLGRHIFVWLNIIIIFTELHAGNRRVFLFFLQRLSFDACRTPKSVNAYEPVSSMCHGIPFGQDLDLCADSDSRLNPNGRVRLKMPLFV